MSMSLTVAGLQKMTLLDFPGHVACTVFLQGCNFRCPFCHNSDLLPGGGEILMTGEEFLNFLKKRVGLLDAVCISGGEPTLQKELPVFLKAIKDLGYKVKLDTNGSRPEVLKALCEEHLVDYVAMDVKNSPAAYGGTVGLSKPDLGSIEESLRYLIGGAVPYELRTTVVAEFHNEQTMEEMGRWLSTLVPGKKCEKLFLQCFVDRDSVLRSGLSSPTEEQLQKYVSVLAPHVASATVRGT